MAGDDVVALLGARAELRKAQARASETRRAHAVATGQVKEASAGVEAIFVELERRAKREGKRIARTG
jgi:hypothetical protein